VKKYWHNNGDGSFGKDNLLKKTFHKVQGEVLQVDESKADQ